MSNNRHIGSTLLVPQGRDVFDAGLDKNSSYRSMYSRGSSARIPEYGGNERSTSIRQDEGGYRPGSMATSLNQRAAPSVSYISSSPAPAVSYMQQYGTAAYSGGQDAYSTGSGSRSSSVPRPSSHRTAVAAASTSTAAASSNVSGLLHRTPSGTAGRGSGTGAGGVSSILDALRQGGATTGAGRSSPVGARLPGAASSTAQRTGSQRFAGISSTHNYSDLASQGTTSTTAVRLTRPALHDSPTGSSYGAPASGGSFTGASTSSVLAALSRMPQTGEHFRIPGPAMPRITTTTSRTPATHLSFTAPSGQRVLAAAAAQTAEAVAPNPYYQTSTTSLALQQAHAPIDFSSTAPPALFGSERPPVYSGAATAAPTYAASSSEPAAHVSGFAVGPSLSQGLLSAAAASRPRSATYQQPASTPVAGHIPSSSSNAAALQRQYDVGPVTGSSTPRHQPPSSPQASMHSPASYAAAPSAQLGGSAFEARMASAADASPKASVAPQQAYHGAHLHSQQSSAATHHPVTAATIASHQISPSPSSHYHSSNSSSQHAYHAPPSAATSSSLNARSSVPSTIPPYVSSSSASSVGATASSRDPSSRGSGSSYSDEHDEGGGRVVTAPRHHAHFPSLSQVVRDLGSGSGCVGLQNLGNTCFMNSILQMLNAVPELVAWCHAEGARGAWKPKASVAPAYADLVMGMWRAGQSVVSPSSFLKRISRHDSRWGEGSQQDANEFLHSLLEALQSDANRVASKPAYRQLEGKGSEEAQAAEAEEYARTWNDSPMDDIFGGMLQSTLQCQACGRQSHCFDPFMGLAVPIPPQASKARAVTVQDCLQAFVETEKLDGSESYKCEGCKKCGPHTKRLQLWRPPRVLVVTLKRFAARNAGGSLFSRFRSTSKNSAAVGLDGLLDLAPYCNPLGLKGACRGAQPVYELAGLSLHSGSLEGGHYTASARSAVDGKWHHFNDASVRSESRPSGASSSAYVLLYRLAAHL